jgi:threonine dehydrogenase-like Zn-dependent dehydrogenase
VREPRAVRAAVFYGRGDVRVEDVPPAPPPGAGEVRIDVEWAAICGTDAAEYLHGPRFVPLERPHPGSGHQGPTILGHEFAGVIGAVGEGVGGLQIGDRVACGAGVSCGECAWCRSGRTNLCAAYYTLGLHAHGGLADHVCAPAAICVRVPRECEPRAAVLAQPLSVAMHALARGGVTPESSVAVVGVGGIGSLIVAAAVSGGTERLVAVDVDRERLETAERLGAALAVLADEDAEARLREVSEGRGLDVVLEASGTEAGLRLALASLRKGGRVVVVGLHDTPRMLELFDLSLREIDVVTTLAHICATDVPRALAALSRPGLARTVIETEVRLERFVEDGLVPFAENRLRGKVVVDVGA